MRVRWRPPIRSRPAENPRQQLPIAAHPAVLARNFHVVTRREFLNDFDVGCKRRACEGALQQIVAEDGVFGDTLVQHVSNASMS